MAVIGRTRFPWEFAAASGAVYAAALWVVALLETADNPAVLAAGLTADLTLLVPGLYWLTCVRGRRWPWISLVPVFVLSVLLASWIIPSDHHGALRLLEYALAPLELALIGFIVWRARRGYRLFRANRARDDAYDAVDAIRAAAREMIEVPFAARIAAYEISIFYLAFCGWRIRPARDDSTHFSCYRESSYGVLFAALMMVLTIELFGVHIGLHFWLGSTVAWIVSILSLYGALWLLGDFQALRLRPIVLEPDRLRLRLGLRWEVDIPFSAIRSIRPARTKEDADLKLVILGEPHLALELHEQVVVSGVYGLRRNAARILLAVDSAERFRRLLADRLEQTADPNAE